MKTRTIQQHNRLFAMLRKLGIDTEGRAELVHSFSKGRTASSRELSIKEANALLSHLQVMVKDSDKSADKMRKKIIHYARLMGWEQQNGKADMQRLESFILDKGVIKKPLNNFTAKELPQLVSQFESIYKKHLKGI